MSIIDNIKDIVGLVQKIDDLELYRRILDLQAEVQQLAGELSKKEDIIRQKEDRIRELEENLEFKKRLMWDNGDYFEMDDNGAATGRPYCSHCWEVDHVPVHVHQNPIQRQMSACPRCKNIFTWRRSK